MEQVKVLVFFNQTNGLFSVEALEGGNNGRVVDHVSEIILTRCKFSKKR